MPLNWFQRPEASRKYVDLLNETSSKWANWDPSFQIRAGDFGNVNLRSGVFERAGNLYTHPDTASTAQKYENELTPEERVVVVHSHHAKRIQQNPEASENAEPVATAAVSLQLQPEEERGAFLVMHRVRMAVVPDALFDSLIDTPVLQDKQLVTEAYSCSGYVHYLSDASKQTVAVDLNDDVRAVGTESPANVNLSKAWRIDDRQGFSQQGYSTEDGAFVPLYGMRKLQMRKRGRRDFPDLRTGRLEWLDAGIPWGDLDEDGLAYGETFEGEGDEASENQ